MRVLNTSLFFMLLLSGCKFFTPTKKLEQSDPLATFTPAPNEWIRLPNLFYSQMLYDRGWFQTYGTEWTLNLQLDVLITTSLNSNFSGAASWRVREKLLTHFNQNPIPSDISSFDLTKRIYEQIQTIEGFTLNGLSPDEMQNIISRDIVLYRTLTSKTEAELFANLAEVKDEWSTSQKIMMTQMIGGRLSRLYDDERAANDWKKRTIATPMEMLTSYRQSLPTGVCRDIAGFQAIALQKMGVKDVYVVTFNSTTPHVTVVVKNPEKENHLYKIDYSALSEVEAGANALRQDDDFTTVYDISKPTEDGQHLRPVAQIPSEFYVSLLSGFGRDVTVIDFFAKPSSPVNFSTAVGSDKIKFVAMAGKLTNGSNVIAIGPTMDWGDPDKDIAAGKSMIAIVHKTPAVGETLNMNMITAVYTQYLNSCWLNFGKKVQGRFVSATTIHGDVDITYDKNNKIQPSGYGSLGTQAGFVIKVNVDEKNQFQFKALTGLGIGQRDARELYVPMIYHNLSVANIQWTYQFDKVTIRPEVSFGYREFGPQFSAGMSCMFKPANTSVKIGYQDAIGKNNLGIAPGTTSLLYIEGSTQPTPWLTVGCYVGVDQWKNIQAQGTIAFTLPSGNRNKPHK